MRIKVGFLAFLIHLLLSSCRSDKPVEEINTGNENLNLSGSGSCEKAIAMHALFLPHRDIDTFLLGDLNFDRSMDTAIVTSPVYNYWHPDFLREWGCRDNSCLTTVKFSTDTAVLRHDAALGFYRFFATQDLNSDGMREVAFIPNWFQSNWQGLFVYSFQNGVWKQLGSGTVFTMDDEVYETRVRKISPQQFEIISMRWSEDGGEMIDIYRKYELK